MDEYEALARAVTEAGFFTNGVEDHGIWRRTIVCSARRPNGELTGNSFWVSCLVSRWYLGAWGGGLYWLPDGSRLADLVISWLSCVPHGTRPDFDYWLKAEYGLVPVPEEEFCRLAGVAQSGPPGY